MEESPYEQLLIHSVPLFERLKDNLEKNGERKDEGRKGG